MKTLKIKLIDAKNLVFRLEEDGKVGDQITISEFEKINFDIIRKSIIDHEAKIKAQLEQKILIELRQKIKAEIESSSQYQENIKKATQLDMFIKNEKAKIQQIITETKNTALMQAQKNINDLNIKIAVLNKSQAEELKIQKEKLELNMKNSPEYIENSKKAMQLEVFIKEESSKIERAKANARNEIIEKTNEKINALKSKVLILENNKTAELKNKEVSYENEKNSLINKMNKNFNDQLKINQQKWQSEQQNLIQKIQKETKSQSEEKYQLFLKSQKR